MAGLWSTMTKPPKSATRQPPEPHSSLAARIPAALLATGLLLLAAVAVAPQAGGHSAPNDVVFDVNNMGCAHKVGSNTQAKYSGPPYHDYDGVRLRTSCADVENDEETNFGSYSVTPGTAPHLRGELYLLPTLAGQPVSGSVCQRWYDLPYQQAWTCGKLETSNGPEWPTPEWYWDSVHSSLPMTLTPRFAELEFGYSATGISPSVYSQWSGISYYSGVINTAAIIDDPLGDSAYLAADGFRNWTIHDPAGDDEIVIGGMNVRLTPGNAIELTAHGIRVQYDSSPAGGNQWTITSTSGDDKVHVWHDGANDWEIQALVY